LVWDDVEDQRETLLDAFEHWKTHDFSDEPDAILRQYIDVFRHETKGQIRLEGSTGYIASERAAMRCHQFLPDAKMLVLLRHPVAAVTSHYWHRVRHHKTASSLRNHIRLERNGIFRFVGYRACIERWNRLCPGNPVLYILAENLRANPIDTLDRVTDFLEVPRFDRDLVRTVTTERLNVTPYPSSVRLHHLVSALIGSYDAYYSHRNHDHPGSRSIAERLTTGLLRGIGKANLSPRNPRPPLDPEILARLKAYFERENRGLSELTGLPLREAWNLDV